MPRSVLLLLAATALACSSTAVGGGGVGGGSAGGGGTGGGGGEGGAGGGAGGAGGFDCAAPADLPILHLETPAGARDLDFPAVVLEHRDLAAHEIPDGPGPVDRLLAVEGGVARFEARLLYRVADPALRPPVREGDRIQFVYRMYAPAGASVGVALRTPEGRLLWAAERGDFGGLATGEPELRLEPGDVRCTWEDCGVWRRRTVAASLDGGARVAVEPGGAVPLPGGDREGRLHLAEWADNDRVTCSETPSSVTGFVLAAPAPGPCTGSCPPGFTCDFPANDCGASGPGTCVRVPEDCPHRWACGCDGELHPSECEAWQAGVDVDGRGTCPVPEDVFRCGHLFCGSFTDVCWVTPAADGVGSRFECRSAPAACGGAADCDCVDLPADALCSCEAAGPDVTVICDR